MTIKYHKISSEFDKVTFKNNNLWIVSTYIKKTEAISTRLFTMKWIDTKIYIHT